MNKARNSKTTSAFNQLILSLYSTKQQSLKKKKAEGKKRTEGRLMRQTLERRGKLIRRGRKKKRCIKNRMTTRDNEKKSIYNAPPDQRPDKEKKKERLVPLIDQY